MGEGGREGVRTQTILSMMHEVRNGGLRMRPMLPRGAVGRGET